MDEILYNKINNRLIIMILFFFRERGYFNIII